MDCWVISIYIYIYVYVIIYIITYTYVDAYDKRRGDCLANKLRDSRKNLQIYLANKNNTHTKIRTQKQVCLCVCE